MRLKTITITALALALSLCAAAQTSTAGISITGPFLDASVENHSNESVLAVNVGYIDAKGVIWRHQMTFVGLGLLPGASQKLHTWSKRQHFNTPGSPATLQAYTVTAVIFMSGELRGDERGDATGRFADHIRSDHPTLNIWQSGILVKLQQWVPTLMAWLTPTAVHAQHNFTNVQTWPYTYYNPPYYPSQWVYVCDDPVFGAPGDHPCPPKLGTTPDQGVSASCGSYNIGLRTNVGIDDAGYPSVQNQSGTVANPYDLRASGYCKDNLIGTLEGWTYLNYCQGNPSAPILYNDNTQSGDLCGLAISGWFS